MLKEMDPGNLFSLVSSAVGRCRGVGTTDCDSSSVPLAGWHLAWMQVMSAHRCFGDTECACKSRGLVAWLVSS